MSAAWQLRPAASGDAHAIAALVATAFAHQPVAVDPPPSALRVTAMDVAAQLASGGGLVAKADTIIGALLWSEQESALYVARISVDPAWRRRGIATALLAAAVPIARARGLARLTLGTRLALTGNRALFAAAGFRETSLETHPGYAAPTWVRMERPVEIENGGVQR